ncbi:MAG: hypothetical protein JWQ59_303 [Cryobacterium sp.]|nr:hypothetical protein [Cryobacterium sp.]
MVRMLWGDLQAGGCKFESRRLHQRNCRSSCGFCHFEVAGGEAQRGAMPDICQIDAGLVAQTVATARMRREPRAARSTSHADHPSRLAPHPLSRISVDEFAQELKWASA